MKATRKLAGGKIIMEIRPFNRGGMGTIHNAYDTVLERPVCIKMISEDYSFSKKSARRFRREAALMATLRHPNIIQIYEFGSNGENWIAMEMLNGNPIESHKKPYSVDRSIRLFTEMTRALICIHEKNIVHCDVKPSNIIFSDDKFVLLDFGLGFRKNSSQLTARTTIRSSGGTPQYASPEQSIGDPEPASDVYSLGCTVYEMLTGELPFSGENVVQFAYAHSQKARPVADNAPPWLSKLLMRCMAVDPSSRPLPEEILKSLQQTRTLDFNKKTVKLDTDLDLDTGIIQYIAAIYKIDSESEEVHISQSIESLKNSHSKSKILIASENMPDKQLIEIGRLKVSGFTILLSPTITEIIEAIEK